MAKNRSIEQKILKMKRRGRYARLSGAPSHVGKMRIDRGKYEDVKAVKDGNGDEDMVPTGKHVVVYVGPISLSKQVMSTGRGPSAERMSEYYARIHSFDQALPVTLGLTGPMKELRERFDKVVNETPKMNKLCLFDHSHIGRVYVFYSLTEAFVVEELLQEKTIRRSRVYGSLKYAMKMYKANTLTWVENVSSRKSRFPVKSASTMESSRDSS